MKEIYGEKFMLDEQEVRDLYLLLETLEVFISRYHDMISKKKKRDDKQERIVILRRIQIHAMQTRLIQWLELNGKLL